MPEQSVGITRIEPHPDNIRRETGDVTELADSIRAQGLLNPLTVCAHPWRPGAYLLLAGHRRLAASKLAGKTYVPVRVIPAPEEPEITMLAENCHRQNLAPVEIAEALGRLRDAGWPPQRISRATSMSLSSVNRYLSLLDLDEASRARVQAGIVGVGTAIAAVKETRAADRQRHGYAKPGPQRRATVMPPHFSATHPLSEDARVRCELAAHDGQKIGGRGSFPGACGACWEGVIRQDERSGAAPRPRLPQSAAARERVAELSQMRLHDSSGAAAVSGTVTAAQAAERLGVTERTIQRYKHFLPATAGGDGRA